MVRISTPVGHYFSLNNMRFLARLNPLLLLTHARFYFLASQNIQIAVRDQAVRLPDSLLGFRMFQQLLKRIKIMIVVSNLSKQMLRRTET